MSGFIALAGIAVRNLSNRLPTRAKSTLQTFAARGVPGGTIIDGWGSRTFLNLG